MLQEVAGGSQEQRWLILHLVWPRREAGAALAEVGSVACIRDRTAREAVHGDHIQGSDTHLARHIQVELIIVQVCVLSKLEFASLVLFGGLEKLLLGRLLDDPLLLLEDGLAILIRQLPEQSLQVLRGCIAATHLAAEQIDTALLLTSRHYAGGLAERERVLRRHLVLLQGLNHTACIVALRRDHRILQRVHHRFLR